MVSGRSLSEGSVEVRRSARRRRTVSAYRDGDRTIVLLPARMSRAEEQRWIAIMLERLATQERRSARRASRGDAELGRRAAELSRQYLGGVPKPKSVRWVTNQGSRWGSCTPVDGTIRLSDRLATMPGWVVDYVLVHELAHLIEIGHGPRFYRLVDAYPKAERARGYLLGVVAGAGWAADPDALDEESAYEAGADDEGSDHEGSDHEGSDHERDDEAEILPDTGTGSTTQAGGKAETALDALW